MKCASTQLIGHHHQIRAVQHFGYVQTSHTVFVIVICLDYVYPYFTISDFITHRLKEYTFGMKKVPLKWVGKAAQYDTALSDYILISGE